MAVQWKKMDENYERLMTSEFQSNGEILPLLNLNCDNLATWLLWLWYVCILYAMMMPQHKRYVNMTARIYEVSNWSVEWCVDCLFHWQILEKQTLKIMGMTSANHLFFNRKNPFLKKSLLMHKTDDSALTCWWHCYVTIHWVYTHEITFPHNTALHWISFLFTVIVLSSVSPCHSFTPTSAHGRRTIFECDVWFAASHNFIEMIS